MAFQINIPNEEAWTKEIASSQTGVVQGVAWPLERLETSLHTPLQLV